MAFQGRPLIVQIKQRIEVCPSVGIKPVSYDASNHKTIAGIRKTVQRSAWYIVFVGQPVVLSSLVLG